MIAINDATRAEIKRRIAYATANRCDFTDVKDMTGPTSALLENYAMAIGSEVRLYYMHYEYGPTRVMIHLSINPIGAYRVTDDVVDQLATEFGLGSRPSWRMIKRPSEDSWHVFKVVEAS